MGESKPSVGFHIGSQQGGIVNNVGGDQRNEGGQHGTAAFTTTQAREQLGQLRAAATELELEGPERQEALEAIDGAESELDATQPDKGQVARQLEHFTKILVQTKALAAAGEGVVAPLQRLAEWLGPMGHSLQGLLP